MAIPSPQDRDGEDGVSVLIKTNTEGDPTARNELFLSPLSDDAHVSVSDLRHNGFRQRRHHRRYHSNDLQHRLSRNGRSADFDVPPGASIKDLIERLDEQTYESHTLRRALNLAVQRIQFDAQQIAAAEHQRVTAETFDHVRLLNERRIAAQQEASKAAQDLRVSEFQLKAAHERISRAEQMLRVVQGQRDDAEAAAADARATARRLNQERLFQSAREEGRRLGFEEGLRKGRLDQERTLINRTRHRRRESEPLPQELQPPLATVGLDGLGDLVSPTDPLRNFDDMYIAGTRSPPPPRTLEDSEEPAVEVRSPTPPSPPQPPPPPSPPLPAPHFDPRAPSPSIHMFTVDIPPTSQLEQQYNLNDQYPARTSQPWVTADEHLAITAAKSPTGRRNKAEQRPMLPGQSRVSFRGLRSAPHPAEPEVPSAEPEPEFEPTKPKKESWYRTLSRRFQRKRRSETPMEPSGSGEPVMQGETLAEREAEDQQPPPEESQSWYQPKPLRPHSAPRDLSGASAPATAAVASVARSNVHARTRSSIDSQSISALEIVGPPSGIETRTPPAPNERSLKGSVRPSKFKPRTGPGLHVINEVSVSQKASPMHAKVGANVVAATKALDPVPAVEEGSVYANLNVMNEWRRSSTTNSSDPRSRPKPPGPRRPVQLTVPAPLAKIPGPVNLPTPIGIKVESPSTHQSQRTPASGKPFTETNYLSPASTTRRLQPTSMAPSFTDVPAPDIPDSPGSFQSFLLSGLPTATNTRGPTPRNEYPKSPRPQSKPLYPVDLPDIYPNDIPRPPSATGSVSASALWGHQPVHTRTHSGPVHPALAQSFTPKQVSQTLPDSSTLFKPQTPGPATSALLPDSNSSGLNPAVSTHTLGHMPSRTSIRSAGSYGRYDPKKYLDPAYFNHAEGGGNMPPSPLMGVGIPMGRQSPVPRAASANSVLSYVTDPMMMK